MVALLIASILAGTASAASLGQSDPEALPSYGAALKDTLDRTEKGEMRGAPAGTGRSARAVLYDLERRKELPERPAGYGAIPARDHARTAMGELGHYVDTLGEAANASAGDARYAAMHGIAGRSRELLSKGYKEMSGELDKLVAGHPKVWQVIMRALLIVSGNKTTATLAEEKAKELAAAVKAMKPGEGGGRPTPGPEVEKGDLKPEIPENELRLVAALKDALAEVHAEIAAADLSRGTAELGQAKSDRPAERIGELDADGRSRATTRTMAGKSLKADPKNGWRASLKGGSGEGTEALRDAVTATPKPEVDAAVGGLERMKERGQAAERSLERVTASGGPIDSALSAIETCSQMALGAVKASNEAVDKNKETNEKLEPLGPKWDAAAAVPDAAGMAAAEEEAKKEIEKAKKEGKKAEDSAQGAFMANQRAMKALRQAVLAVTGATRDLGLDEKRAVAAAE